jgi:hypothetical protein
MGAASELTAPERQRLAELEAVIERGLDTFAEVGRALLEIRDARLYRETHATFEAYLRERWGMSRQRGYQLMDAARVSTIVDTAGLPVPPMRPRRSLPRPPEARPGLYVALPRPARVEESRRRGRPNVPPERLVGHS